MFRQLASSESVANTSKTSGDKGREKVIPSLLSDEQYCRVFAVIDRITLIILRGIDDFCYSFARIGLN